MPKIVHHRKGGDTVTFTVPELKALVSESERRGENRGENRALCRVVRLLADLRENL